MPILFAQGVCCLLVARGTQSHHGMRTPLHSSLRLYAQRERRAQVDVLITVSGFAMMPSQSAAVAARFGMRDDLDAYHLAGHGCAGSTLSICLARQMLLAVRALLPKLRSQG